MGAAVAHEMAELYGLDDEAQVSPWYCPICDVSVTNDMAYLDHINGVKHLKKIGYSMRVRYVCSQTTCAPAISRHANHES
jgi:hypothetical protein